MVVPSAFKEAEKSSRINETAVIIAGSVLIGASYLSSLCLILFNFHERAFLIQSLLVYVCHCLYKERSAKLTLRSPGLVSNALALFNVLINVFCRDLLPLTLLEIVSLSFPAAFSVLYALCALWLYSRDVNATAAVEPDQGTALMTDEEMQRQQLQRLLESSSRKSLSPRMVQKTYQVNHPDRLNSFLPPPHEDGYFG